MRGFEGFVRQSREYNDDGYARQTSFGQTITAGTTYTVVVTGIYGNVVTYSQTD